MSACLSLSLSALLGMSSSTLYYQTSLMLLFTSVSRFCLICLSSLFPFIHLSLSPSFFPIGTFYTPPFSLTPGKKYLFIVAPFYASLFSREILNLTNKSHILFINKHLSGLHRGKKTLNHFFPIYIQPY